MSPLVIVVCILLVTFGLLIFSKLPPAAVFIGALTLTITFKLAPLDDSLKGFSNPGVLTIGALFMIAAGMYSTGAVSILSEKLIGRPRSILKAQLKILPNIAFGSAFLNNTPLVAMMIPVIRDLSRSCGLDAKKLLIPVSYASILGGTCTLIGTATNLVIAGLVNETLKRGGADLPHMVPVGMFDLSLIGVPVTIVGLVFLMTVGTSLLPATAEGLDVKGEVRRRWFRVELAIEDKSPLIGKTLDDAGLMASDGFYIMSISRNRNKLELNPDITLVAGDMLSFSADVSGAKGLWATIGLKPLYSTKEQKADRHRHHLVEVVVSRRNPMIGHQIGEVEAADRNFEVWLVAFARGEAAMHYPLEETVIQAGDVALLEVKDRFFYRNRNETDFAMTKKLRGARIQRTDKALLASVITGTMVFSVAFGLMSMLNAALLAAGGMLLSGCMNLEDAGRSVDFSTLMVIASAMGLESAVTASGLSSVIGDFLGLLGGDNAYMALAVVFLGCVLMDAMVTNVASAVFMFPISMSIASALDVSFMPFVIVVMVGASCSFISPVSYQTNLMVYGPGKYSFGDFVKIGIPLTMLVGVITVFLTPLFFPFHV
ncbi:di-/tricarboxylate transporter [Desulfocapsa sulfexigens DSM 10523]|uniref:Di-/tricarboxylate transporter n=1 Tax=Desulfocapsa sulfexigens (strain DSM 10523 / SB164P1) TaxID=1167006 RepID=M1NGF0_DESSD|nr:SLC13 family permease [Desulfocapsa sulfexigens]AGF78729.1 di-/tricarboxylate transporter [Desulfocapsa sulfexigens DSM 10523]